MPFLFAVILIYFELEFKCIKLDLSIAKQVKLPVLTSNRKSTFAYNKRFTIK